METLFSIVLYIIYGFFGLIFFLFILALLFGKRIKKLWEYEAEFCDASGREFGEFDFEMSKIVNEEAEYRFKARFRMRHESIGKGQMIQVFLDDLLVMQGNATHEGRIYLKEKAVLNAIEEPDAGQVCRVVWGGIEQFRAPIKPD